MIKDTDPPQEQIILFTRYPEPGRTKTRLIPALGEEQAAALQKRMTEEILTQVAAAARSRMATVQIHHEGGDEGRIQKWLGNEFSCVRQAEGDLGEKMHQAILGAFARDCKRVVVLGTDCPALTPALVSQALDALRHCDLVLGPARDGGYYCIGLSRDLPHLFTNMPWGTERVLAQTLSRARDHGITVHLLPVLNDIDRPEDLADPSLSHHFQGVPL